jgi:hypothetical protein
MIKRLFFIFFVLCAIVFIAYGGFVRKFMVYDNLEKFDSLKDIGISIKIPGYEQQAGEPVPQAQPFTEPEIVNASTFEGVSRYKDGRLMSNYPDLSMLKGRMPCPT